MKPLKCSRCGKRLPDRWEYHECKKCRERTVKRYPQIRAHGRKDFDLQTLFTFRSFEDYLEFTQKARKRRITKVEKEKLRKEWSMRKQDWEKKNAVILEKMDTAYAFRKYPMHSQLCYEIRTKSLKHLIQDEPWDAIEIDAHMCSCPDCRDYINALRTGTFVPEGEPEPDSEAENELRKEGYVGLAEWSKLMSEFNKVEEPDPYEKGFRNMRDCCLRCGSVLQKGVCPVCQNDRIQQPDPQQNIGKDDPYQRQLEEQFKQQQQQEQRQQGFLDRLRRNPRENVQ